MTFHSRSWRLCGLGILAFSLLALPAFAQFPGGPGGPMRQKLKVVERFDKDGDKRLDATERKAAREYVRAERTRNPRRGGPRFRFNNDDEDSPKAGRKISPEDVKGFPKADLYDPDIVRTLFLEFEDPDWEQELAEFKNTDVEVPAKLTVDGKVYPDVGVHFRGMSSFSMVGEGHKRSLNLSFDFVHNDQRLLSARTLNLLNSHDDPTFLRTVLYSHIARQYIPAPKANFVQVVINGEDWGIYVNAEQFNKDFARDRFGETKGARWKVPGSPGGRGGLEYLGPDASSYEGIYQLSSKEDPKAWKDLARLCRVLNETPAESLEKELSLLLDIDGALKFLALENVFINDDGYWIRTSDYSIYEDTKGQFHIIPHDTNETFSRPGGPAFGGGGMMRINPPPTAMLATRMLADADRNGDDTLTRTEFSSLARIWFTRLDRNQQGRINEQEFMDRFDGITGRNPRGPNRDFPGGGAPPPPFNEVIAPDLFKALDSNKDGVITIGDLQATFDRWFRKWDTDHNGTLDEEELRAGLGSEIGPPNPPFQGNRQNFGPGRTRVRVDGVKLDPLAGADDPKKPLISKLLAVPKLRARYLEIVRELTEKWLDWKQIGPIAEKYQALISKEVEADTRKLASTADFHKSLTEDIPGRGGGPGGRGTIGLKSFIDQRGAYLREYLKNEPASQ
jgi:Ca2+-binding EF-hand superfamily protein